MDFDCMANLPKSERVDTSEGEGKGVKERGDRVKGGLEPSH